MTKGQAERLMPLLEEVLAEAGMTWKDLTALGVGIGPGNFTGVRIAVSAARALSFALKIPAIGISATEAAAFDLPRPCRIVIPTRADQVIWQDFTTEPQEGSRPQQAANGALPPGPAPAAPAVPPAVAIVRLAALRAGIPAPRPAPLYMRPADAAPARDAPPLILP